MTLADYLELILLSHENNTQRMDRSEVKPEHVASSAAALAAARTFLAENGNHEVSTEFGVFAYIRPLVLTAQQVETFGPCLTRFDARKQEHEAFITQGPHDQNQPTGERFIIVNRRVEIPNAWAEFLANDDNSFESVGYRSLDGLTFDWNRYAVADEEAYYFYSR